MTRLKTLLSIFMLTLSASVNAQTWPSVGQEAKPGARWWWLGSAVNRADIDWNINEYAKKGIGALEITPLYGVQGNDANNIDFLSPKWMQALKDCEDIGQKYGVQIDMNSGTGWPFGGPEVPIEEAACKLLYVDTLVSHRNIDQLDLSVKNPKEVKFAQLDTILVFLEDGKYRVIAVYNSRTRQKVKRAAPGGEGWVIDHFNKNAVKHYLERFDKAFASSGVPYPNTFFNDSYEVYGADWTPTMFEDFYRLRGYKLEDHMNELLGFAEDKGNKVVSDYRETLSDLLLENFTNQWTNWAHSHGAKTRNQAHGSPANLIDIYAAVDIPEIEGFGKSEFGIKGLWKETKPEFMRKNDSDLSMLKYASSAAHVTGKPFTSSETFTWLTEHFRTSLAFCKPDFDLMMVSGVNHIYYHGICYSPKDDPWPGWRFYASMDMSPTNSIWHDAGFFNEYITRCQSFMQWGKPDNDFIVLLPVRDMWSKRSGKSILMQFAIHDMKKKAPEFIRDVLNIDALGYDCDYISERYLLTTSYRDGSLITAGGTRYKALIIPGTGTMPDNVKAHIESLRRQGAHIIYGVDASELAKAARPEAIKSQLHLKAIRRSNDKGYHYFISNLTPNDVDEYVTLAVPFSNILLFNPLNGDIRQALTRDGKVRIALRSGESIILETFNRPLAPTELPAKTDSHNTLELVQTLDKDFNFSFLESAPTVNGTYRMKNLSTWERLPLENASVTMGTGVYETTFRLKQKPSDEYVLDLGDVRESARVYLNGEFVGCAWCVPYTLDCGKFLRKGKNTLRIEVTNLPANRIAELDRQGVQWRKFNEINVVKLDYSKGTYGHWDLVPSGLNSAVKLYRKVIDNKK